MRRRSRADWLRGAAYRAAPVRRCRWGYASPAGSLAPATHRLAWSVVSVAHRRSQVGPSTPVRPLSYAGRRVIGHVDPVRGRPVPPASCAAAKASPRRAIRPGRVRRFTDRPRPPARPDADRTPTGHRLDRRTSRTDPCGHGRHTRIGYRLVRDCSRAGRPGGASLSPVADLTHAGRTHARHRMAIVRPEISHRSRPPPRCGVTRFAFGTANPQANAYVWRKRPSPRAAHPVHGRSFERRPQPSHPDTPGSGGAHRPTLVRGPFLLQVSEPLA